MMHSDRELGWANFWNFEQYGFHETFMRALSEQLLEEAQQMVGGKDLPQFGFRLYYGLAPIDWESRGQSGSTTVSLLVPPSFMLPIRVGWTTTELLPEDWYRRALAPGAATFSWADHFPLDQVRSQLRPQRTITSKQTQHPFPIEIYPTSLPDISLGLTFDQALTTVECQTLPGGARTHPPLAFRLLGVSWQPPLKGGLHENNKKCVRSFCSSFYS